MTLYYNYGLKRNESMHLIMSGLSSHVRESRFRNPEDFFPVESGILGFKIWNVAQGLRNLTKDWNPESWAYFSSFLTVFRGIQIVVLKRKKPISGHCVLCPWTFK